MEKHNELWEKRVIVDNNLNVAPVSINYRDNIIAIVGDEIMVLVWY